MAKQAARQVKREDVRTYVLKDTVKGDRVLGPYPIVKKGGDRVVSLTPSQARYYLDQGLITEQG